MSRIRDLTKVDHPERSNFWSTSLERYLKAAEVLDKNDSTIKNYRNWIAPFCKHLEDKKLMPSTLVLKDYLMSKKTKAGQPLESSSKLRMAK